MSYISATNSRCVIVMGCANCMNPSRIYCWPSVDVPTVSFRVVQLMCALNTWIVHWWLFYCNINSMNAVISKELNPKLGKPQFYCWDTAVMAWMDQCICVYHNISNLELSVSKSRFKPLTEINPKVNFTWYHYWSLYLLLRSISAFHSENLLVFSGFVNLLPWRKSSNSGCGKTGNKSLLIWYIANRVGLLFQNSQFKIDHFNSIEIHVWLHSRIRAGICREGTLNGLFKGRGSLAYQLC